VRARFPGIGNRRKARPAILGNPVAWRDQQFLYGGNRYAWLVWAVLIVPAIGVTAAGLGSVFDPDGRMVATIGLSAAAFAASLVLGFGTLIRAARAFNTERLNRTLEVLLASDLTVREIIRGKQLAILRAGMPWLFVALGCALGVALLNLEQLHMWTVVAGAGFSSLAGIFCYSSLALLLSLRFRTPAVLGICAAVFIGWNWIGKTMITMLPLAFVGPLAAAFFVRMGGWAHALLPILFVSLSLLWDVGLGVLFLILLHRNFRANALKGTW
jgi:ABC-type transport system involved in multi-copper enzyme maturation permease subunit